MSFVSCIGLVSVSAAQAHAQGAPAQPVEEVAGGPSTTSLSSSVASDPNIDRGFLLPTAMTQPAGSVTYNNYELLLHGITYGISDRVQTTVTMLSPITTAMPLLGFAALKGRIVAAPRFHLALQASLGWGHSFTSSSDSADVYTLGAGAIGSFCLKDDCSSLLSASATYQWFIPGGSGNSAGFLLYGGSLVHEVSQHIKLLAEVTSAAGELSGNGLDNMSGLLASYGVRFHTDNIAGDVGFIKPFVSGSDGGLLLGIPFVNFSYRWQ